MATPNAAACAGEIAFAVGQAAAIARNVIQNAGTYAIAVVNSAQVALNRYQGTTLGIAAAAEFIGLLVATLGAPQLLGLLAAVGLTLGTYLVLVKCLHHG